MPTRVSTWKASTRLWTLLVALLLGVSLAACAPSAAEPNTETSDEADAAPVELTFYYRAQPQPDIDKVEAALSEVLTERINATIDLVPIDPGAWNDRIRLAVAGGEKMDLVFTANWTNNYYQNVAQGNFIPLDDLLEEHAPGLLASMRPEVWDAARVNGQIYGVPNQIAFAQPWGIACRKDLLDKYEFDLSTVNEYAELEPYLQMILEGEEDVTPLYSDDGTGGTIFRSDNYVFEIVGGNTGVAIRQDDPDLQAFNVYATDEFREAAELARRWYEAGYYTLDPLPSSDATAAYQAGRYACHLHLVPPGSELDSEGRYGFEFVVQPITKELYITTSRVTSNMLAVSQTSENPEQAVMLLELLNTDKEIYNLLAKGIEGEHWVWVDKENEIIALPEGVTGATAGYNPRTDYLFGSWMNSYIYDPAQIGLWDSQIEVNQTAAVSAGLGFAPDLEPYSTELAAVSAVIQEYAPLNQGRMDPEVAIPEMLNKLEVAGIDTLIEGIQEQLDEWKASRE